MKKICVIYGGPRKKNTYGAVQIVKEELSRQGEVEFEEFFLPQAMPKLCNGCFACILKDPELCPHREYIAPVERAMREADGLLISTPVYVMDVTAHLKALLDHFGFCFLIHRPFPEMFWKSALVVSTTAGAGTGDAIATVRRSFENWGISRVFSCGFAMRAKSWQEMPARRQESIKKNLEKSADRFYRSLGKKPRPSLKFQAMFRVMREIDKKWPDGHIDKEYWRRHGWLDGKYPWKQKPESLE